MKIRVILLSFLAAFSVSASITITKNSSQRLSFIFDMKDLSISTYRSGSNTFSSIIFNGSNTTLYKDGTVALPSLSIYVGVPQSGTVTTTFISHSVKRITLDHPLCAENKDTIDLGYTSPSFDNPWMSRVKYVHFRGMRTGKIYIKPFKYDTRSRVLTVLLKGSCTINFPSGTARPVPSRVYRSDYYEMLKSMVLNYDVAKNWIFFKRPQLKRLKKRQFL